MPKKTFAKVDCSYIDCFVELRLRNAFKDVNDMPWCQNCKLRGLLVNYGAKHSYPEIRFAQYAIGPDRELWIVAAMLGNASMIEAAVSELGLTEEEAA